MNITCDNSILPLLATHYEPKLLICGAEGCTVLCKKAKKTSDARRRIHLTDHGQDIQCTRRGIPHIFLNQCVRISAMFDDQPNDSRPSLYLLLSLILFHPLPTLSFSDVL